MDAAAQIAKDGSLAAHDDQARQAASDRTFARRAWLCAGALRYRAACSRIASVRTRLSEPVERRDLLADNDRPNTFVARILGSGAGRHPPPDLLPAAAAVVVPLWAIGARRPRTERGFRYPDHLRRRNVAWLLSVAQRPSGTPGVHHRLSGRGMV